MYLFWLNRKSNPNECVLVYVILQIYTYSEAEWRAHVGLDSMLMKIKKVPSLVLIK